MNGKTLGMLKNIDFAKLRKSKEAYETSMLNIPTTDPWVPIKLGSAEYQIEFGFKTVTDVFRKTGKDINAGEFKLEDFADRDLLVTVLTCGLQMHHEGIDEDFVMSQLTMKHRLYYATVLSKAFEATEPDQEYLYELSKQLKSATSDELEVGDTTAPLPAIVDSPVFGRSVED